MTRVARTTARAAETRDAEAIARIYNHGIEDRGATFETELRTPAQIEALLAERAGRYPMVVVEREGEVIAWAGVTARSRTAICRYLMVFIYWFSVLRSGEAFFKAACDPRC